MQNVVARAETGARKFDCITPILKQLQWLPVARQLVVRDAVIAFKCLHGLALEYLCSKFIVGAHVHSVNTGDRKELDGTLFRTAHG